MSLVNRLRAFRVSRNARIAYGVAIVIVSLIVTVLASTLYTNNRVSKTEQSLCELLQSTGESPQLQVDPSTQYGREVLAYDERVRGDVRRIRRNFDCPGGHK